MSWIGPLSNPAAVALGLLCASCATTGLDWVAAPEPGLYAADSSALAVAEPANGGFELSEVTPRRAGASDAARPRLSETKSLGETRAAAARVERETGEQPGPAPAPPVVVIHQYIGTAAEPAATVFAVAPRTRAHRRSNVRAPASEPRARTPQPGGSYPAPPSYGPAFPYKTAPASPWEPAR